MSVSFKLFSLWETHFPIIERGKERKKFSEDKTMTRRHWGSIFEPVRQLSAHVPNRLLKLREPKCHEDRTQAASYSFEEVNSLRSMAAAVSSHRNYGAVKHKETCGSNP